MRDASSTPAVPRPGASLLGGVIAAAGALAMGATIRSLRELAQTSHGHEILILWVLLGLACLGALLCLHLTLIWVLAATILLAGPASRTGAALLGPLRVLAPRLARRLASGAAVATAATALTLAPGIASPDQFTSDQEPGALPVTRSAELLSTEAPPTDPAPEAAAPVSNGPGTGAASPGAPLPPLGWGGEPSPAATDGGVPAAPDAGTSGQDIPDADPDRPPPAPMRTIVVQQGDSLWSISDGLLGPDASDPAEIAATWPLLHETNRGVIGDDPDRLRPGQQLTVPTAMTTQDMP
ncbi:LysM peptidoglycan-binding domain-containing protein [Brachybacterium vulturis]|uniref:LysM peptidoglycan-binding domain-containing protein n=1 Tax=Brachybacterium vulturis TaxID=2017484 RepID=UPI003734F38E